MTTETTQSPHRQQMSDLCRRLHAVAQCAGVDPWDQDLFARVQRGRSEGEKIAASFVLTVWCGGSHSEWSGLRDFCMVEAAHRCDREICRVMADWLLNPFYP